MENMHLFTNNKRGLNMKKIFIYIPILISLIITIILITIPSALIPNGYELAIDGYILSRTLCILYLLNLLSKIGFYFLKKHSNNN